MHSPRKICNFAAGTHYQHALVNCLRMSGIDVVVSGVEDRYSMNLSQMKKRRQYFINQYASEIGCSSSDIRESCKEQKCFNSMPQELRILVRTFSQPDTKIILNNVPFSAEIRKREIDAFDKFIQNNWNAKEFGVQKHLYPDSLLIYICPSNRAVRSLNTAFDLDSEQQESFWKNTYQFLGLKQFQLDRYVFDCSLDLTDSIKSDFNPYRERSFDQIF
ncbi:hypothetical protein OA184_04050 [SAR86 cluster bacterium]|nr:hypothetical protein [SAR86 cluster bacterium]